MSERAEHATFALPLHAEQPRSTSALASRVLAVLLGSAAVGCDGETMHASSAGEYWRPVEGRSLDDSDAGAATLSNEDIHLPPPPFTEGVFPCSDCHDPELPVRTEPRDLEWAHQEIVLRHDEEHRWCLDCHAVANRDVLHLAGGAEVAFEESHLLCGQCHGDKHRDWRAGVHGRRTGSWSGEKQYLLCVHCHDAHDPAFKPIRPEPPPPRPRRTP
jgi:hypothetical protein